MVAHTYHISPRDIIDFAPYLFHIVAGASLGERKGKIDEAKSALSNASRIIQDAFPHLPSVCQMSIDTAQTQDFIEEEEAIDNQQLFNVDDPFIEDEKSPIKYNPFTNYLVAMLEKAPEQLRNNFEVEWRDNALPIPQLPDVYFSELTALPIEHELFSQVKDLINDGKLTLKKVRKLKAFTDNSFLDKPEIMSAYLDVLKKEIEKIESTQQVNKNGEKR